MGVAAVFAELNRGNEVTKGLRKVDKSEMTHKNPALRSGSVVPGSSGSPIGELLPFPSGYGLRVLTFWIVQKKPVRPTKPQALAGKKPPKFILEGNKWIIVCAAVLVLPTDPNLLFLCRSIKRTKILSRLRMYSWVSL